MKKLSIFILITGIVLIASMSGSSQSTNNMISLYLDSLVKAFPKLTAVQLQNATQIILSFGKYGDRDFHKLNYILATAYHESKFYPVREIRGKVGTDLYNRQEAYWNTGFYGRGYIQLTHRANYERMSKFIGLDLVANPDLMLISHISADAISIFMMNGFTGVNLNRYINANDVDYYNSRRTVNDLDQAQLIESYAYSISKNLKYPIA